MLDHCINLYDESVEEYSKLDKSLFKYVLDNIERDESGRIVVPALWDKQAEHLLSDNFKLAHKILWSTYKKLKNHPEAHSQDDVIQDQFMRGNSRKNTRLEKVFRRESQCFIFTTFGCYS